MLGSRYIGYITINGKIFTNELISGSSGSTIKEVIKDLHCKALEFISPEWAKMHNIEYHITDRSTGKTIII